VSTCFLSTFMVSDNLRGSLFSVIFLLVIICFANLSLLRFWWVTTLWVIALPTVQCLWCKSTNCVKNIKWLWSVGTASLFSSSALVKSVYFLQNSWPLWMILSRALIYSIMFGRFVMINDAEKLLWTWVESTFFDKELFCLAFFEQFRFWNPLDAGGSWISSGVRLFWCCDFRTRIALLVVLHVWMVYFVTNNCFQNSFLDSKTDFWRNIIGYKLVVVWWLFSLFGLIRRLWDFMDWIVQKLP
jgi:hypothetical protein